MTNKKLGLFSILALAAGVFLTITISSETILSLITQAIIYAIFALGIGILLKQNGLVSFGHALYFGLAGYAVGLILNVGLMPAELAIFVAILGISAFSFLIGVVIVRVPGISFGMLTLAIGQMFYLSVARSRGITGGADGMPINWPNTLFGFTQQQILDPSNLLLICWVTLVLLMVLLALVVRSRFGAITEAVRDNEERARFIGIPTVVPRAAVYALSAAVTSVGGILAALNTGFISPESLHWSLSGMALMMVVVGGFKVLWGPVLGAVVYFLFKDVLGEFATHWMSIFGVALIAVIVFSPTGLAGMIQRFFSPKKMKLFSPKKMKLNAEINKPVIAGTK